jgi:DNA replicative helicase MCM subunit Mcm2 (Cdc46/Mcm family)
LADQVERVDVAEAVRLMNIATQSAATDPTTGESIHHQHSTAQRDEDLFETAFTITAVSFSFHSRNLTNCFFVSNRFD